MEVVNYIPCRDVRLLVDALQKRQIDEQIYTELWNVSWNTARDGDESFDRGEGAKVAPRNELKKNQIVISMRVTLKHRRSAFRRALRGEPFATVEPLRVVKPDVSAVKARPRTYSRTKVAWLPARMATLIGLGSFC